MHQQRLAGTPAGQPAKLLEMLGKRQSVEDERRRGGRQKMTEPLARR
jgi:hypothetical protein